MNESRFFTILVLALMASATACRSKNSPPPGSSALEPTVGTQARGASGETTAAASPERVVSRCPVNRAVRSGDLAEVGGALFRAYQAALKGDTPEAFDEFLSAFHPGANRTHLETQIFPRVVEHVGKYVASPSDPSFTICRIEGQTRERVKVFVRSNDLRKSDPPSILVLHEGKWLLDSMTP